MKVTCQSGRELEIPPTDSVFVPTGDCQDGDPVDPVTVDVEPARAAAAVRRGTKLVVDNRVEVVAAVAT